MAENNAQKCSVQKYKKSVGICLWESPGKLIVRVLPAKIDLVLAAYFYKIKKEAPFVGRLCFFELKTHIALPGGAVIYCMFPSFKIRCANLENKKAAIFDRAAFLFFENILTQRNHESSDISSINSLIHDTKLSLVSSISSG